MMTSVSNQLIRFQSLQLFIFFKFFKFFMSRDKSSKNDVDDDKKKLINCLFQIFLTCRRIKTIFLTYCLSNFSNHYNVVSFKFFCAIIMFRVIFFNFKYFKTCMKCLKSFRISFCIILNEIWMFIKSLIITIFDISIYQKNWSRRSFFICFNVANDFIDILRVKCI